MQEIRTYRDLLEQLQKLSEEQLNQEVQATLPGPSDNEVVEGLSGIAIGTVEEAGFYKFRSIANNQYRANDVVLLLDRNQFAEDGAVAYGIDENGEVNKVIYDPKLGKTRPESQWSPQARKYYSKLN